MKGTSYKYRGKFEFRKTLLAGNQKFIPKSSRREFSVAENGVLEGVPLLKEPGANAGGNSLVSRNFSPTGNTPKLHYRPGGRSAKIRPTLQSSSAPAGSASFPPALPRGLATEQPFLQRNPCGMWFGAPSQSPSRWRRPALRCAHLLTCGSPETPALPRLPRFTQRPSPYCLPTSIALAGNRARSWTNELLTPDPPDGQGPGTAFALRGTRHKVCPERFGCFPSSPTTTPLSFRSFRFFELPT